MLRSSRLTQNGFRFVLMLLFVSTFVFCFMSLGGERKREHEVGREVGRSRRIGGGNWSYRWLCHVAAGN